MKNWKRLLALSLAGIMALSLCACKPDGSTDPSADAGATGGDKGSGGFWDVITGLFSGDESAPPSDGPSPGPDASAAPEASADLSQGPLEYAAGMSGSDVALTVNGKDVPADLFLYWLDYNCYYFMASYGRYGLSLSDYADGMMEEAAYFCISQALMRQKAAELGCLPTDAQVKEARDSLDEETCEMLRSGYGLSDESINVLILSNAYYDNLLAALTHEPDAQELEEYMAAQGFYRVKHILIKTVDDSLQPLPDDEAAEKRAQAEALLAELQAAPDLPALFDQRMNELSEDGRDGSGDLYAPDGYLAYPGQMDSAFEAASQALEDGGLSGIVESVYGCHIILRLPLAPFTDDETATYAASFRADALDDMVQQWQDGADITRADALSTLDVSDFYARISAYRQAMSLQEEGAG